MTLALYGHPFSSYTQKVLIALYENATPFAFCSLGPDHPQHAADWLRHWPLRKFPLLLDGERSVAETSIIIEYLQLAHPGPVQLLPADPVAALDVRFLDRFFDLHVMSPVQHAVNAALTGATPTAGLRGWLLPKRSWRWPTPGWKASWPAAPGPRGPNSPWPIARPHPRCSMPTGRTPSAMPSPCCAPTAHACWPGRRSPGRWPRHGRSGRCFRWGHQTGTEVQAARPQPRQRQYAVF